MNLFRLAFELFVLYLLYKLIFDFIIPVAKTTSKVKKQFSEMSAQMQEKMNQQAAASQNAPNAPVSNTTTASKGKNDDYIEFEEIK